MRSPSYGISISGVTRGAQLPGCRITMGASNRCGGRQMIAGGAGKSQQCHMCILQCSKFVSERSQVRTWGRQTCFLPLVPFNLVTPQYKGVRKGVVGVNPPLSLMLYNNFIICAREIKSTYCKYHGMNMHANFKEHCKWAKK